MKKVLLFISLLFLVGCSHQEKITLHTDVNSEKKTTSEAKIEKSQEELNQELIKTAEQADFVQINGHAEELVGQRVWLVGEITFVDEQNEDFPHFTISTKEGEGYGIYDVWNVLKISVSMKEKVKVYGVISGTNEQGMPMISSTVIEKKLN